MKNDDDDDDDTELIEEKEFAENWKSILDNDESEWNLDSYTKQKSDYQLKFLNNQIEKYYNFPYCQQQDIDKFVYGRGSSKPKVVFILTNPAGIYENKHGCAFFPENGCISLLERKIKSILKDDAYYLMYLFPYYLGKDRKSTTQENIIFLSYAKQRITILKPKIVVVLGLKAASYIFSEFNPYKILIFSTSFFQLMETTIRQEKTKKIKINRNLEIQILTCPHPFQIVQYNPDYNNNNNNNQQYLNLNYSDWEKCFKIINEIINNTGSEKIDLQQTIDNLWSKKKNTNNKINNNKNNNKKEKKKKKINNSKSKKIVIPEGQISINEFLKRKNTNQIEPEKKKIHKNSVLLNKQNNMEKYCELCKISLKGIRSENFST